MLKEKFKVAILDMNNNQPNQGLRCIADIVSGFKDEVDYTIFNVRGAEEIPDTSFDIYISSGGPDSPLEDGPWRIPYLNLVQDLWDFNKSSQHQKKYMFFICYSFQVVCDYFKLGEMKPRRSTSFGVLPIHKTKAGLTDPLLEGLDDPFYAVDSRDWQLVQPRLKVFKEQGASILSLEKIRSHVSYERAIMAVRFSKEFVGTQFHPEADPVGMRAHFLADANKLKVIANFGEEKYDDMMEKMDDPDKIIRTHKIILPKFIERAMKQLSPQLIS
ncbi:type 1 glutamine amidotransferase [Gelidibacter maritimus]|uniref:GMP synthase n=1 Tax=Gelidibacter maritimus TaxID=2761487 RepID=A0A7W2M8X8_9FLAO|nr:GMP synthase [Gelidibacter maritimus]MBA6154701.1 GMP synthase [Gelidibacter maritimus]